MVALNKHFAPENPHTVEVNRVGIFFGESTKSSRANPLSAEEPRLKKAYGYDETASGMFFYGYRYYDPETGRWSNRDPIQEQGGFNLYCFVFNAPLRYIDYLGWNPMLQPYDPGGSGGNPMLDPYPILDPFPDPLGPDPFAPAPGTSNDLKWSANYKCPADGLACLNCEMLCHYSSTCTLLSTNFVAPGFVADNSVNGGLSGWHNVGSCDGSEELSDCGYEEITVEEYF